MASETHPASPCLGICLVHPQTRLCRACLRSIDEIADWYRASAAEKRAILARIEARRSAPPGAGREYSKQEFARDIYLLDQSGRLPEIASVERLACAQQDFAWLRVRGVRPDVDLGAAQANAGGDGIGEGRELGGTRDVLARGRRVVPRAGPRRAQGGHPNDASAVQAMRLDQQQAQGG